MSEKRPEDLSVEELRRLLIDKRQVTRKDRLERFRRTGQVMAVALDANAAGPFEMTARPIKNPRHLWMDCMLQQAPNSGGNCGV